MSIMPHPIVLMMPEDSAKYNYTKKDIITAQTLPVVCRQIDSIGNQMKQSTTVASLQPHQALVWIDRWAKLTDFWHPSDLAILQELKSKVIHQWQEDGTIEATRVIQRDTPAIAKMRKEIADKGENLNYLNPYGKKWQKILSISPLFKKWKILADLNDGILAVPIAVPNRVELEYQQALTIFESEYLSYERENVEYFHNFKQSIVAFQPHIPYIRETLAKLYEQASLNGKIGKLRNALDWIQSKQISNAQWVQIQKILVNNNVTISGIAIPVESLSPKRPVKPTLHEKIGWDEYIEGTMPSVDEAIAWAKATLEYSHIDFEDLHEIVITLEEQIAEEVLSYFRNIAIDTFHDVLAGEYATPDDVYTDLVSLELDYASAIGMANYSSRYCKHHSRCSRWHQVNLDLRGYWLIEFRSTVDPAAYFHLPYSNCNRGSNIDRLPIHNGHGKKFDRSITKKEQQTYPIEQLLSLFKLSPSDFRNKLKEYSPPIDYDLWNSDTTDYDENSIWQ